MADKKDVEVEEEIVYRLTGDKPKSEPIILENKEMISSDREFVPIFGKGFVR